MSIYHWQKLCSCFSNQHHSSRWQTIILLIMKGLKMREQKRKQLETLGSRFITTLPKEYLDSWDVLGTKFKIDWLSREHSNITQSAPLGRVNTISLIAYIIPGITKFIVVQLQKQISLHLLQNKEKSKPNWSKIIPHHGPHHIYSACILKALICVVHDGTLLSFLHA